MITATAQRFLFFTNSEYGQSNVVLSVAHELALRPNVAVHIASFSGTFLPNRKTPQFSGTLFQYTLSYSRRTPWLNREYEEIYRSCVSIITKVEAHAIVVEPMASQAIDACHSLGLKFDIVATIQPFGSIFRYPALSSGFSYPVPWYHIPKNLLLTWAVIFFMISSTKIRELDRYRQKLGLTGTVPVLNPYIPQGYYLCPATPKTEFPCIIPDNLTLCGPILPSASPVGEGTHVNMDVMNVRQLAMALRILLDRERKVQVIWKLIAQKDVKASLERVKVVDWLGVKPLALLRHDNLVCVVNHGGANSFFEAMHAGIPQIILPAWYDCYGIHGNKNATPGIEAVELGHALTRIVGDGDEAVRFRAVAKELGEDTRRYSGRVIACDKILEFASRQA
ncbi:hypothetical protein F5146DRAFT_1191689 [Armillaria mellea]|nr:hypothetical protein F5146DRAFT_1191689 [Armillaria mellea]